MDKTDTYIEFDSAFKDLFLNISNQALVRFLNYIFDFDLDLSIK